MNPKFPGISRLARLLLSGLAGVTAWGLLEAQPVCSIDLGNDTTICAGNTVTLEGPAGFPNYLWSTGEVSQNITVAGAGSYSCQVTYPTGNLVTNGNFSGGNMGFNTMFNYGTPLTNEGNYWIGTNAALYHPQFQGTGNGQFMMVNAGWMHTGWRFWCQTLDVCPGQTYVISFRAASLATVNPPVLAWFVNNSWTGLEHTPPATQGQWQTFNLAWTAPAGTTSAEFCIQVSSGWGTGNDFGFDDVDIRSTVVLNDQITVNVTPLPTFDLGPDLTMCEGQSLILDAAVPGGTYLWQDGSTNPSVQASTAGNYNVTVSANGCSSTDDIDLAFNPLPVVDLGPDLSLCTGQSVVLDVTQPNASYGWSDGSGAPTLTVTGPGTYGVTVFQGNCFASDQVDVAYNAFPTVNIGPDVSVCAGDQFTFDATTPGATYTWHDGSTAPTFTANSNGPVTVDVTVNNCTTSDQATLTVTPYPAPDLGPDVTVCPGTTVTLDVTTPGAAYLWQDGSTGATFQATTPGTYSVDVTVNNCTTSDAITIDHFGLPVFDLPLNIALCQGNDVVLDATVPGASYVWSTGSTNSTITVNATGTYTVDVTLNGCTVSDAVDVLVTPTPAFDLGPDQAVCPGDQVTLDATLAGGTYVWNTGANTPTLSVGPGAYSVEVTVNNCPATDAITVTAHPAASVDLGNDTTLCPGQVLVLNANQLGASTVWQDGSIGSTFTVSGPGTYDVDLTDANGCFAQDAIIVQYANPQVIDLGNDTTLCSGATLTLNASVPGGSYTWSTGSSAPSITVNTAGSYSVIVVQGQCSSTDAVDVDISVPPIVDLGSDTVLCPGQTLALTAGGPGLTYAWNTGAVSANLVVGVAGTYSVIATNADGCADSDAISVSYASPTAVDLGSDITLCQGNTAVLDATVPGATYLWSTGETTPTITVGTANTYSVEIFQGACSVTDALNVQVNAIPVFDLGSDVVLCAGQTTVLDASVPGATHLWSTGATTPTITVGTTGLYSVTATLNGCPVSDQVQVTVLSTTAVDLGADITLCQGNNAVLDATVPGATYLWSTGETTPTITVGTANTYSVEIFQGACSVTDALNVQVNAIPVFDLGSDVVLCAGQTTVLDATVPGATHLWSTGATTPSITVGTTGLYSVTATLNGCPVSDQVQVTVLSTTAVDLGADITLCQGNTAVLDATVPGATYLWSTGETTPTITVGTANSYSVEIFQGACSVTDALNVQVNAIPVFDLGSDVVLCAGQTTVLDATVPGATHLWSTGATTPTITVGTTGLYSVTATLNGCPVSDQVQVTVLSTTAVDLGSDITLCQGNTAVLDATVPGATYLWSTGQTTPSITVGTANTYSVEIFQGACSVTDAVNVQVDPAPVFELGIDQELCAGATTILDATSPGSTYLWSTGATTPTIVVGTAGNYSVTATINGCTLTDEVDITVFTPLAIDLGPNATLCQGDELELDATVPGATYLWSTGAVSPSITVNTSNTYSVQVFQGGCSVADAIQVVVNTVPVLELGDDQVICAGESTVLNATAPGSTYLWNTGATSPTIIVDASGTYGVIATLNGCTVADQVEVTVLTPDAVDLGDDEQICLGNALTLDATLPGASYTWSTGASSPSLSITSAGTYWVVVQQGACTASDTIVVAVTDPGQLDLGDDATFCTGDELVLDATYPGATYLWSDGITSPIRTVTLPGTYGLVRTLDGCEVDDEVTVLFNAPPVIDLGPAISLCPGESTMLDATLTNASYAWSTGSTASAISVSTTDTYSVEVTVNGCTTTDAVNVTVVQGPVVDLGPDMTLCAGDQLVLSVAQPNASYLWDDGTTGPTRTITTAGTFGVTVVRNGCSVEDEVMVNVFDPSVVDLGPDQRLCPGEVTTLVCTADADLVWSTGATASSISVNTAGTYWVEADNGGCVVRDSMAVSYVPLVAPDLGADRVLCDGDTLWLEVPVTAANIQWSNGSSDPRIALTSTTPISITATLENCSVTDAMQVYFLPPVIDLAPWTDSTFCPFEELPLDAYVPFATYQWSDGSSGPVLDVTGIGTYSVAITTVCANMERTITISEGSCAPLVNIPNAFTPNGDGFNDVFHVVLSAEPLDFELLIFDRWGERIFSSTDPQAMWDGSYNGSLAQDGVYVYQVTYRKVADTGVVSEKLTGHVTLLR